MKLELLSSLGSSLGKGDDILQKDRLVNGIIERLTNNFELKPSEVYVLLDYVKQLQEENKELSHIVANKVISDYDIDTPLKKELGEANLKIVSLEAAIHCYKQEREDLIKWLEDKIKECDKTLEILNSSLYTDEIKSDLSTNPIIPKVLVGNFLETLDKVRGINND